MIIIIIIITIIIAFLSLEVFGCFPRSTFMI